MPDEIEKLCKFCDKPFIPYKRWQIYCSKACNNAAYWQRKIKQPLEVTDGPSEAQENDRQRRRDLTQEEVKSDRAKKIAEEAELFAEMNEEIERRKRENEQSFEDKYSPNPATEPRRQLYNFKPKEEEKK